MKNFCYKSFCEIEEKTRIKVKGKFSLRLIGSAIFGETFNLVTRVGVP